MYSYYTGLVFKIDLVLLIAIVLLATVSITYAAIKEWGWRRRTKELASIKNKLYELTLSGQKIDNQVCLPETFKITPRLFLDVVTNKMRGAAFFNETEQRIFKQCFASKERLAGIEKIAQSPWNKWNSIEAILSLGYLQAESTLATLKRSINKKDKDTAYFSIIALGQIHTVVSAKILLGFLRKRKVYYYKVFSVLETFPAEIAEEVIKLTDDTDPQVRAWAIKLISRLKAHSYIKRIEEMVFDKSEDVRASACDCLGEFANKGAKDALTKALNDDFWLVRVHAVKALAKVLGKECLPEVIGQINDASLSVIDSLKNVVTEYIEAALPYVEKFLYSNDEIARRVSVEALEASGYIVKVFKDILTGSDEEKKRSRRLLEGLILSRANFGLEGAMAGLTKEKREKLLDLIRGINKEMADYLEKGITTGTGRQE